MCFCGSVKIFSVAPSRMKNLESAASTEDGRSAPGYGADNLHSTLHALYCRERMSKYERSIDYANIRETVQTYDMLKYEYTGNQT